MFVTENVPVPKWLLLLLVVAAITLIAGIYYFYYLDPNDTKRVGLIGGVISGGLVFLLTYAISI